MAKWTEAQARAIFEPSGEGAILVSAAAGSGKTAVLVERIAQLVMRENDPVSIDELLVVTFTDAAAAEMKERIIARIGGAYRDALENGEADKAKYLKEQMHLTAAADIETIDAFCLGVVKNNFHIIGVDPNFGIMDKNQGSMLMDDAISELFAKLYASQDREIKERFERLGRLYSKNRDDEGLKSIVLKIYGFIQAFADPIGWLRDKADMYSGDMASSGWVNHIFLSEYREYILSAHKSFWTTLSDKMRSLAAEKGGEDKGGDALCTAFWGKLWSNVQKCREAIAALEQVKKYDELPDFYQNYIKSKSILGNAIKEYPANIGASEEEWRFYYREYDRMRDNLRAECASLPAWDRESFNEYVHSEKLSETIHDLVWLTCLFSGYFDEKKTSRNVKSFSDIEHLTCRLFLENENIRGEYAERYKEILIDEFQDTNGLQDTIFTSISRDGKNIFMVGDLKQSIYRFRGGDPMIFKEKSRRFLGGGEGKRINLSQNFRSRREVLDGVNTVFSKMMSDRVGDVEYDGNEELSRDKDREIYTSDKSGAYNPEYYNISVMKEDALDVSELNADMAEAECIAERITSLIKDGFCVEEKGAARSLEYRDIVILMRSVKKGYIIRDVLEKYSIPAFVQKEEYFERREIKLMLSLISVINNHRQDIPLAAVMRSPIGNFTENELAMIKIKNKRFSFYGAVKAYKAENDDENLLERKCRRFIADLDRWRSYVKMKSIASLIWTLYEETGFYDFMGALEGGEEAQANLRLLYERAKKYEESGYRGIFNFIRYIERIGSRSDDISGAKLVNESHNVVRIMTIHKSKGLEFPVVFLAHAAASFMKTPSGEEKRIVLNKTAGLAIDYYDYEDMYVKPLMFTEYIKEQNDREHRSEQMRLMYVAMTRAREKLIVTSSKLYSDEEAYAKYMSIIKNACSGMSGAAAAAEKAENFSSWIFPAVINPGSGWDIYEKRYDALSQAAEEEDGGEVVINSPDELREAVRKVLEFNYEFPQSGAIPAKTSVTAIKEMADEENENRFDEAAQGPVYMIQKPAFMQEDHIGARIGTAHHQVMAFLNLDLIRRTDEKDYEAVVRAETERIASEGQIEKALAADEKVKQKICENICRFLRSGLGAAVLNAREVCRERAFEIEITAREYDPYAEGINEADKVMVQGIIDLYFEDNDGNIILVDYKTDKCKTEEEQRSVAERYRKQIELYGRAMEKILNRNVKEKYLYLFSANSVIQL